jgi:uncharacterized protein YndB with AHSA1/START domain
MQVTAKTIVVSPIRQSIVVSVSRERAFDLFTSRMADWWFTGEGIGPRPFRQLVLEPRKGGRWFERAEDGAETNWGEVLDWDRPARVLLAWQIDGAWKFDPDLVTSLEITFEEMDANSTCVRLEHRDLERLGMSGGKAVETMREGWGKLLGRFADLVRGP